MSSLSILGMGFLFCFLLMTISWWVAQKLNFYSLVDVMWAYGIGGLGIVFTFLADGATEKKVLALFFSLLWSLRLGTYLALRQWSHYPVEDRRYLTLKAKWNNFKFFQFFQFQGVSQILFSLPFLFLATDPNSQVSFLTWVGLILFLIGFLGEAISDNQLRRFKSLSDNKDQVCRVGLWRYSRHPNYFFEWVIWCGISVAALSSPYGYWGLVSPLVMYLTLNYLTGIPAAEEQSLKSKGDKYREYQKTTNRFFPGISI